MENKEKNIAPIDLDDDQLEGVSGGYAAGDTVTVSSPNIEYCPKCARLIANLPATVTGVRGILNGKTIYWVTFSCCGHKTSRLEDDLR